MDGNRLHIEQWYSDTHTGKRLLGMKCREEKKYEKFVKEMETGDFRRRTEEWVLSTYEYA